MLLGSLHSKRLRLHLRLLLDPNLRLSLQCGMHSKFANSNADAIGVREPLLLHCNMHLLKKHFLLLPFVHSSNCI